MSIDSDVIRGHVDTIILKTLTTGDKYGYEIIKEIEQKSKGTYELKQPTLYSCLKRLENQGLISGFTKNSDIGGKRHYYKLTKKGRETYENSMAEWFNSRSIIDSLMGSKPTNLMLDDGDSEEPLDNLDGTLDNAETTPEPIEELSAQLVLDGENVVEEAEPATYENRNLDEEEVQLIGDYYKTDENQINLFEDSTAAPEPHWTEQILHPDSVDENPQNSDPDEFDSSPFKNYEGANLNSFKDNTKDNYFESISYGIADENNVDVTTENTFDEADSETLDQPEDVEDKIIKNENSAFCGFGMFSHYNDFNAEDDEEEMTDTQSPEEFDDSIEPEPEPEHSSLNFGFGYTNEDSDDMNFPSNFMDMSDTEDAEPEPLSHISIFGEDDQMDEDIETETYGDFMSTQEEYSTPQQPYLVEEFGDLKPYNLGNYTEPEYKEKLNQLSSYTKATYETKPQELAENNAISAPSINELTDELMQSGIAVRAYSRPSKEAIKDKKYLLVNKIKFVTSWIVYGIMAILLLGTYFIAKQIGYTNLNLIETALPAGIYFIITAAALIAIPITYTIIYLLNKTKKIKPNYSAMISFVFALLFFIVCLNIIYTLNILNGFTKFTQTDYNHLLWLLPCVASLFILFQSAVYSLLFRSKRFNA